MLYRFLIFFFWLTPSFALPPWPEAIRGDWKEINTPESLPVFCNQWKTGQRPSIALPAGTNHFCDYKAKHYICLKYMGKDREACIRYLAKGIADTIGGAKQNPTQYQAILPYFYTEYGNSFFEIKDYLNAEQQYRQALRLNKRYLPALVKLSDTLIKQDKLNQAEQVLNYALKIAKNPNHKKYLQKRLSQIQATKKEDNNQ